MTLSLPQTFLDRMSGILGKEYPAFLSSYDAPRTNGLRINTLKISMENFLAKGLFALEQVPWACDGFYYNYTERPGQHPYFTAGAYYLQEPSAMAAVHYLDPQPGEWVLDLAAAPGGKTTQIAARLKQQGLLWANEIHPARARILAANLDKWGTFNSIVSNESPDKLAARLGPIFDRILLDAPCSGEGMFRKDPEAINEWSPENVLACAHRQSLILESAAKLLKPGGRLVYSTCTFSLEENEQTILSFLKLYPDFSPATLVNPAAGFVQAAHLPGAVRLYPHRLKGEGHFIAVLERKPAPSSSSGFFSGFSSGSSPVSSELPSHQPKKGKRAPIHPGKNPSSGKNSGLGKNLSLEQNLDEFYEFEHSALTQPLLQLAAQKSHPQLQQAVRKPHPASETPSTPEPPTSLNKVDSPDHPIQTQNPYLFFGNHLYLNPAPEIPLQGLTILRPGLHLGEKKPGRFQPGQALAFALAPGDVQAYLALKPEDPRLERYLHGESWTEPGPNGWVLAGVDEFPLGWAKRVDQQLKNHFPKELRK